MSTGKTYSTKYLLDNNNNRGSEGQVLISTSEGVNWSDGSDIIGGPYLPLSAGSGEILTGDLAMNNNIGIITKDSSGAFRDILKLNSSNVLEIGSSSLATNTIFKNSGNVGIGTTSPSAKLQIDKANANSSVIISRSGTNIGASTSVGSITFPSHYNSSYTDYASIQAYSNNLSAVRGSLDFKVKSTSGALLTGMTVYGTSSGVNVGIGTTSPNNILELYKTVDSGIGPILQLTNTQYANADNSGSSIQFRGYALWGPGSTNPRYSEINAINGSGSVPKRIEFKFYADTDEKTPFSVLQTGNVGIGTTSPSEKLVVDGKIRSLGDTSSADFYSTGNDALIVNNGTQNLKFWNNGSERMRIKGDGNVGIGTTSPGAKLHIKGSDPILLIQDDSTGTAQASSTLRLGESGAGGVLDVYWDIKQAADDLNTHLEINHSSNGNHLTILDNGNVGIGTTLPIGKFNVSKDSTTDGLSQAITVSSSSVNSKRMNLGYVPGSNYAFIDVINYAISNTNQALSLQPNGGNVGIGTTSPSHKLEVGLTSSVALASQPAIPLMISNNGNPVDGRVLLQVKHDTVNTAGAIAAGYQMTAAAVTSGTASYYDSLIFLESAGSNSETVHSAPKNIEFYVNNYNTAAGAGTSYTALGNLAFELQADGDAIFYDNVGIGTTSPGAKLDVVGSSGTSVVQSVRNPSTSWSQYALTRYGTEGADFRYMDFGYYRGSTEATRGLVIQSQANANLVTFLDSGNVGIGTTSPGYRLEVDGGIGDGVKIKAGNAASKDSLLVSTNNDVSKFLVQGDGKVIINSSTGISGRTENFQVFGKQIITNTGTDGPVLYLGYNSSGSNTIQLGRGRTADGLSYMDFNGEVMSAGQFGFRIIRYSGQNASTELNHIGTGAFKLTCTNSADIILNPNSGSVGISQTNPSHKLDVTGDGRFTSTVTATNFILSSDERLKENVEKVCDNRVEADWKTFELKTDKGQKRYGVIAQELEKTNPEFVREDSKGFKSVAYIDLLIAKIAELEARLEKLEK